MWKSCFKIHSSDRILISDCKLKLLVLHEHLPAYLEYLKLILLPCPLQVTTDPAPLNLASSTIGWIERAYLALNYHRRFL